MWSLECRSLMRASTDAIPRSSGEVAAISCLADAADGLVLVILSPEAANKGVARTIAPRRVAAAVVARAVKLLDENIVGTPEWLDCALIGQIWIKCNFGARYCQLDSTENSGAINWLNLR